MTVVGIDVSSWQGTIDWAKARPLIQFAMLRASHGKNEDAQLDRNRLECKRLDIPYGIYHYAQPAASWQVQADFFLDLVPEKPPLGCWLDCETADGQDKVALESWYFKWIKHVSENGLTCGIYTSPGFWDAHLALTNWAKFKPLWVACWTKDPAPTQPLEWRPKANPNGYPYQFWQWSANGNGKGAEYGMQSTDLDLDRFNGDEAKFNRQFGTHITPLETPPPPPSSEGEVVVVATGWANLRSSPEVGATNDIGNLLKGSTFKPVADTGDWYEIHGYVAKSTVRKA